MDSGKNEYTFYWSIENFSFCWHLNGEMLSSPDFTDGLDGTTWDLELFPRGCEEKHKGHTSLFLHRSDADTGPEEVSITYELSALASDGLPLKSGQYDYVFEKDDGYGSGKFFEMDEILLRRKADYLQEDILRLRCKIWKGDGEIRNIGQSSARTRIKVEKISFIHEIERFSTLQPKVKQTIQVPSHPCERRFISSSLFLTEGLCCEKKIMIEIVPYDTNQSLRKCKLSLLDGSGNELECGMADVRLDTEGKSIQRLPLSFTKEEILNKKSEYLPNGKLSLLCECTFSAGLEFESIEEIVHKMPFSDVKELYWAPRKIAYNMSEKLSSYTSALEDIKDLYINKSLTDVQVKTKTKSFPAHKLVLCARSPVFKQMLTSDMREKNTDCIEVDDLEDDVVHQLLLFLYSDTVEDLQWTMATRLYYAADKYEIGRLKAICSSFLLEHLTPSTAGELLLLSDTHSDADLKKLVEEFILEHEEEVFGSDEWEKLMETHPVLVMKAMHFKYKKQKIQVK